ncbi:Uncharacterized protein TCAP_06544 [Tolypocladium capitatum]|uniref:Peptidase M50B-like-domain-containing protein n=1 Tax=Tolypocladium capitatum TaxID=45235 RepID=A0A2K3Q7L8_9HYPO|nr:Uncharacterized protein TCAP_06544 [Tolypocladium capitatum]
MAPPILVAASAAAVRAVAAAPRHDFGPDHQHHARNLQHPTHTQQVTLGVIAAYVVAIAILWNVPYLRMTLWPFKVPWPAAHRRLLHAVHACADPCQMLVIAFHEFGHAITAVLTGGRVKSISLDPNEGGVTHMQGGISAITLPAGYLGSSIIGALLIFCGFNIVASKIASIALGVCFLLTMWWGKRDWLTILTVLLAIGLLIACWFIVHAEALRFVVLFIGVMSSLYSVWDICDDLILRKVNSSDASVFAKRYGGSSQCWGVIWSVISVLVMAAGIVAGLAAFSQSMEWRPATASTVDDTHVYLVYISLVYINLEPRDARWSNRRSIISSTERRTPRSRSFPSRLQSSCEVADHLAEEARVGEELALVPHHDAAEAAEIPGELDGSPQLRAVGVAATGADVGRDSEQVLDVGVQTGLGPSVPDVKVEGVLGAAADVEVGHAAKVVVVLDHDEVEGHGVEGSANNSIRERALRRCRQIELLAAGGVHEAAELVSEGGQVVGQGLKVEVEAVDNGVSEGTVDVLAGLDGAEHGPDHLGRTLGGGDRGPAALSVGGPSNRQQDGLVILGLAGVDVVSEQASLSATAGFTKKEQGRGKSAPRGGNALDLWAPEDVEVVGERGAVVASIGKVGYGRGDAVHKGNGDDLVALTENKGTDARQPWFFKDAFMAHDERDPLAQ